MSEFLSFVGGALKRHKTRATHGWPSLRLEEPRIQGCLDLSQGGCKIHSWLVEEGHLSAEEVVAWELLELVCEALAFSNSTSAP